ncbi:unnamed protein product [Heterobilharzia americana]|nr:unnamed protein product [Heterobilharzia americana]
MMSDLDQSEGIVFDSHILANTSVSLTKRTLPPFLYTSAGSPSGPAALPRFRLPTAFSTSSSVGGPVSMSHSGSDWIAGSAMVAGGQLNCSSKCSAHRSSRLPCE